MKARTRRMRIILRNRRLRRKRGWCTSCSVVQRRIAAAHVASAIIARYGSVQAFVAHLREDDEDQEEEQKKAGPVGIGTPSGPAS